MKNFREWFNRLKVTGKATFISALIIVFLGVVGVTAQPDTSAPTQPANSSSSDVKGAETAPVITTKSESTTESIPYTSSTIQDSTLAQGTTKVQTTGVNGELTHTYQVTYTDGVETSRSNPVDTITTPAINEVIIQGSKAPAPTNCPNGTYVNSAGNTVCSPYSAPSTPSGATAECHDGSYSFSQSRSGTCSHHGGVAAWL